MSNFNGFTGSDDPIYYSRQTEKCASGAGAAENCRSSENVQVVQEQSGTTPAAEQVERDDWIALAVVMYQAAGAYSMPEHVLDLLSAAQGGEKFSHLLDVLPVLAPQPAPVVPDRMTTDPDADVIDPGFVHGWNACRDAMLDSVPFSPPDSPQVASVVPDEKSVQALTTEILEAIARVSVQKFSAAKLVVLRDCIFEVCRSAMLPASKQES